MCQHHLPAVRPTGRERPTFIMLCILTHQDRRPHRSCLPAMDSISCQILNRTQELFASQQSRPGTALKELRHCIQVPKNTARVLGKGSGIPDKARQHLAPPMLCCKHTKKEWLAESSMAQMPVVSQAMNSGQRQASS